MLLTVKKKKQRVIKRERKQRKKLIKRNGSASYITIKKKKTERCHIVHHKQILEYTIDEQNYSTNMYADIEKTKQLPSHLLLKVVLKPCANIPKKTFYQISVVVSKPVAWWIHQVSGIHIRRQPRCTQRRTKGNSPTTKALFFWFPKKIIFGTDASNPHKSANFIQLHALPVRHDNFQTPPESKQLASQNSRVSSKQEQTK